MKNTIVTAIAAAFFSLCPVPGVAHDPSPAAQNLLNLDTNELPQGLVHINAVERIHPPGARTPWHTSGPKLIHLMEGTLTAYGLGGQVLLTCGPGPKVCFHSPQDRMWFFRNNGSSPVRFLLIGIDSVTRPTIHEEIGQVVNVSGNRITLALGDLRTSDLAVPRRELIVTIGSPLTVTVGDNVVTVRHDDKNHTAEGVLKLAQRWQ
ncbi:MAG TPA: hypothetical protein VMU46_06915 [Burkholderiales bacterium]|nr:hypothetical protein [Burkholderiales bacterium]